MPQMSIIEEIYAEKFPDAMDRLAKICQTFEPDDTWKDYFAIVDEAAAQLESLAQEYDSRGTELAEKDEEISEKDSEIESLQDQIVELKDVVTEKDEIIEELHETIKSLKALLSPEALKTLDGEFMGE